MSSSSAFHGGDRARRRSPRPRARNRRSPVALHPGGDDARSARSTPSGRTTTWRRGRRSLGRRAPRGVDRGRSHRNFAQIDPASRLARALGGGAQSQRREPCCSRRRRRPGRGAGDMGMNAPALAGRCASGAARRSKRLWPPPRRRLENVSMAAETGAGTKRGADDSRRRGRPPTFAPATTALAGVPPRLPQPAFGARGVTAGGVTSVTTCETLCPRRLGKEKERENLSVASKREGEGETGRGRRSAKPRARESIALRVTLADGSARRRARSLSATLATRAYIAR